MGHLDLDLVHEGGAYLIPVTKFLGNEISYSVLESVKLCLPVLHNGLVALILSSEVCLNGLNLTHYVLHFLQVSLAVLGELLMDG